MATGKLVGRDDVALTTCPAANYIWLTKFTAVATGNVTEIRIRVPASTAGNIVMGIYTDVAGAPTTLLGQKATAVSSGPERVITITLDSAIPVIEGTAYWKGGNADVSLIGCKQETAVSKYKIFTYAALPNPAGTGYTDESNYGDIAAGWGILVISPSGLSQPIAYGTPKLSLSIYPPGHQQAIAYGEPTIQTAGVYIYPPGLEVVIAYGTPSLRYPQTISPPGLNVPIAYGTPTLIPGTAFIYVPGHQQVIAYGTPKLILTIKPSGIAQAIAYGTPSLKYPQTISPPGLSVPIAYGTPSIVVAGVGVIYVPGHQQVIGYGTPTILKYVWHVILDGQYLTETPETNRTFVIGRDVYGNPVWGEAHDTTESALVGERLDFQPDPAIPTTAQAADVAAAVLAKMRLSKKRGVILIPYNCGQELWDVVQISDAGANQSAVKFRVVGLRFEYHPKQARYEHKLILGAP